MIHIIHAAMRMDSDELVLNGWLPGFVTMLLSMWKDSKTISPLRLGPYARR